MTCSDDGTFRLWDAYNKLKDNERKLELAVPYENENVSTVKTKWRNKRKYETLNFPNEIQTKNDNELPHSKICRFYNVNFSSTCLCQNKSESKKGCKRLCEDSPSCSNSSKRKFIFSAQERTPPPNQEKGKVMILKGLEGCNSTVNQKSLSPVKLSSKRKLEDMPSFIEECNKSKKINMNKILTPSNVLECKNKEISETGGKHKNSKSQFEKVLKENNLPNENNSDKISVPMGLSSPTSNLPNYVEDGTSPYIHRCRKTGQKENDWLSKLKESYKSEKNITEKKIIVNALKNVERKKKSKKLKFYTVRDSLTKWEEERKGEREGNSLLFHPLLPSPLDFFNIFKMACNCETAQPVIYMSPFF